MLREMLVASSGVRRRKDRCCQPAHRKFENVDIDIAVDGASDAVRLCPDWLFFDRLCPDRLG